MSKGWYGDPERHRMSALGIKSTVPKALAKDKSGMNIDQTLNLLNTDISLLGMAGGRKLTPEAYAKVKELNNDVPDREWIADLDIDHDDDIVLSDTRISDKVDESQMEWNHDITDTDPYPDPEHCIGYIHSHPPAVDPRPSAQDFILALTIDDLRLESNKDKHPGTMFGVVTTDKVKFFTVIPKGNIDKWMNKLKSVQNKNYSVQDNDKYFDELEEIKDDMRAQGVLKETEWMDLEGGDKD